MTESTPTHSVRIINDVIEIPVARDWWSTVPDERKAYIEQSPFIMKMLEDIRRMAKKEKKVKKEMRENEFD